MMSILKRFLIILLLLLLYQVIKALPICSIKHYSSQNGLPENTVMSILQDSKGYMWFGTWDGLCKFDGYSFTSYKVKPGDSIRISNSRVDDIVADTNGYLWVLLYGQDVCRFDPNTGTFENIPLKSTPEGENWIPIKSIKSLSNGVVWLSSDDDGAFRVTASSPKYNMKVQEFSVEKGTIRSNKINDIFLDSDNNEWLLSENGLFLYKEKLPKIQSFFYDNESEQTITKQSFHCHLEMEEEIWFGSSNGRLWQYYKKGGRFKLLQIPTTSNIRSIHKTLDGSFFISTFSDGFFMHNSKDNTFEHYSSKNQTQLPSNKILGTYITKRGNVWIQQDKDGITHFKPSDKLITYYHVNSKNINYNTSRISFYVVEDINGNTWIHPHGGGLSFYDPKQDKLIPFYNEDSSAKKLFSNRLHSIYSDKQGNLWFGTRSKGLEKVTFASNDFKLIQPSSNQKSFTSNDIRAVMQDKDKNYWLGSKNDVISIYDSTCNLIGHLTPAGTVVNSPTPFKGTPYSLTTGPDNSIWIGTKGAGLFELVPKNKYRIQDGYKIVQYTYSEKDLYSISNNNVYSVYADSKERVWIATFGGGLNLLSKKPNGKVVFYNYRNNLSGYPNNKCYRTRYITEDFDNNICVGTTNGLITFNTDYIDPESINFNHYTYQHSDSSCLSNNDIHYIHVSRSRDIYLASYGGGLNKLVHSPKDNSVHFEHLTITDGLSSDALLGITEDFKGNLWINTENGLSKFLPKHNAFENYNETDIGFSVTFSEAAIYTDHTGAICIGTTNGLLYFHPDSIQKSSYSPPIVFTDFKLFNASVKVGGKNSVLEKHIDATNEIILKHYQNMISLEYAALEMKNPQSVQFSYMLEGLDNNWNYVGDKRIANYTNLSKGQYVLKVKSTNGDGIWCNNIKTLKITVLPTFWETPLAILIYFIATILILFTIVYILFTIYRLRHKVQIESQMAEMKLNFFTDISHELRTPLTLISAPIENILKDSGLSKDVREQINLVESNTKRMLRLINQILDFVKLQKNKMKLRLEEVEMKTFLTQVMDYFRLLAIEKNIQFELKCDIKSNIYLWIDSDKMEKIIFNLLSNAFKYIKDGKSITLHLSENDDAFIISVKDTGIGINENKAKLLFDRFENIWAKNSIQQPSTGIGLSIVHDLVEMLKGTIEVNTKEGVGTEFILTFKKGLDHFPQDVELIVSDLTNTTTNDAVSNSLTEVQLKSSESKDLPKILLVEDNEDVRHFIKKLLCKQYKIYEASNGEEGLNLALDYLPDLIVSDLMMPKLNGIELLDAVRSNFNISHTPFIILSAKTALKNQLSGFEKGADAYVTKPFSTSYLLTRIESLLAQRQNLHDYYNENKSTQQTIEVNPDKPEITSLDAEFLKTTLVFMEQNMDNGDLIVEDFVEELAVSRSVFFKKIKSLTGFAPVEFIKEMRLKRAVQFLEESDYNLSQISYLVGINTPRYFSKCFKEKYGMTPSKYRNEFKKKESNQ